MYSECDLFFDSYGCVFKSCEGYQSPFPLVKLASPVLNFTDAAENNTDQSGLVTAIAHIQKTGSDKLTPSTSTSTSTLTSTLSSPSLSSTEASLCTFDFNEQNGCKSFYHLLETSPRRPIKLREQNRFYAKLEACNNVYGTLSFSITPNRERSTTSDGNIHLYHYTSAARVLSVNLSFAKAMSLTSHSIWSVHECQSSVQSEACISMYEYSELFHLNKAPLCTFNAKFDANSVVDLFSRKEESYVFEKHSICQVDSRQRKCLPLCQTKNYMIESCGVANSGFCNFITYCSDNVLRVWDSRFMLAPVWQQQSFEYLAIKTSKVEELEEYQPKNAQTTRKHNICERSRMSCSLCNNLISNKCKEYSNNKTNSATNITTKEQTKLQSSSIFKQRCTSKDMSRCSADYVLLLSSSQVAVMDVNKGIILGAHELADGVVLDAVLLGQKSCTNNDIEEDINCASSQLLRLCTSSSSGMIYDITMGY